MSGALEGRDPREFALQLAVVAERLDERSARAVERVESVAAAFAEEAARARDAMATERTHAAAVHRASELARMRTSRVVSIGLAVLALFALGGTAVGVAEARRELASITRDQALLDAINRADVTLCDGRLCARIDGDRREGDADGYRRVALRPGEARR